MPGYHQRRSLQLNGTYSYDWRYPETGRRRLVSSQSLVRAGVWKVHGQGHKSHFDITAVLNRTTAVVAELERRHADRDILLVSTGAHSPSCRRASSV